MLVSFLVWASACMRGEIWGLEVGAGVAVKVGVGVGVGEGVRAHRCLGGQRLRYRCLRRLDPLLGWWCCGRWGVCQCRCSVFDARGPGRRCAVRYL